MPRSLTDTIKFLTLEELGRLFAATRASKRDRAMFLIAYRHGLRASEVGLLRVGDVDFRALRITLHRLKGTPLIWEHVNPYGRFELDMNARITALQ